VLRKLLSILPTLWVNWITVAGTVITTVAGCTLLMAFAADALAPVSNQYTAAALFLIGPAVFLFGLLLIPIGLFYERRRHPERRQTDEVLQAFRSAVADKKSRRRILFFLGATLANIAILGAIGNRGLAFMNSAEFCGTLCHTVMQPEYDAYMRSPHSRVACVDCHIGAGASWAAKAKIDGLRQVWAVITDSFNRPIPAPVHELRPARDTCEQCHWPDKFHGNRVAFSSTYKSDEENTLELSAYVLNVGGVSPRTGEYQGIHWHVSPDIEVRYEALDDKREQIGKVTWTEKGELKGEYEVPGEDRPAKETRVMDCVDCHNRPTHIYDHSPEHAIDRSFTEGRLDRSLPFLRKVAVQVLTEADFGEAEAEDELLRALNAGYDKEHSDSKPPAKKLEAAAEVLADLYRLNISREMKVGWDTYPDHLGHRGDDRDKRGCFRCHDDEHATKSGTLLRQDCDLCHELLHMEEGIDDLSDALRALYPGH
jgi:hypothetical protein